MNDFKEQINQCRALAYKTTPGLLTFMKRKKYALWILILLALSNRIALIYTLGLSRPIPILLGLILNLSVPAIFSIAAYNSSWKMSCFFYAIGAYLLKDLIHIGIPILMMVRDGLNPHIPIKGIIILITETLYMLWLFLLALWLTIPAKNRSLSEASARLFQDISRIAKESHT